MDSSTKIPPAKRAKLALSKIIKKCKQACGPKNKNPIYEDEVTVLWTNETFSSTSFTNTRMPHWYRKLYAKLTARIERKCRQLDADTPNVILYRTRWDLFEERVATRRAAWAAGTDTVTTAAPTGDDGDQEKQRAVVDLATVAGFRFDTRCRYEFTPCVNQAYCESCARWGYRNRRKFVVDFRTERGRERAAWWMEREYGTKAVNRLTLPWFKGHARWWKAYRCYLGFGPWYSGMLRPTSTLKLLLIPEPAFEPCTIEVRNLGSG